MRVSVLVGVISVVFASSAHAATLVATTDQAIYQQGDLVTVTLTGTTVGAGPGITEPTDLATHIDVRGVGTGFTEGGTDTGRWDACVRETAPPLSNFCLLGNPWAVGGTQGPTVAGNYLAFSPVGIEPATDPVPQLLHLDASRLGGALAHPLSWCNRLASRFDRALGASLGPMFDSWVMRFVREP